MVTIEGLSINGELQTIQEAFVEAGAVQCGFCAPGVILSAKSLLDRENFPTEEDIRRELSGHLCRCTGYVQFVEAVRLATIKLNGDRPRGADKGWSLLPRPICGGRLSPLRRWPPLW